MKAIVMVVVVALVLVFGVGIKAQEPAAAEPANLVGLDFGGSSLDAQSVGFRYARRVWDLDPLGVLYVGVSAPIGSLTGGLLDGNLNLSGLAWKFQDVDRGVIAPTANLRVNRFLSFSGVFGDVCVIHQDACDGYAYLRLTADVSIETGFLPVTIQVGREGLVGDGQLDGRWLRAVSVRSVLGF